ncbi:MAG: hypothetical protein ACE5HK_02515 [Candidatus Methylomirabilales bacterium]
MIALWLALFGVASGGVSARWALLRPYLLPVAIGSLGFAYYWHYGKRGGPRWHRYVLWVSTALVIFFWLTPLIRTLSGS